MITSSREAKQEGGSIDAKLFKAPSTSSRQWAAFRNPRIVRVSRAFGGKDRHSKVCTVRGLRDRRIRLSAPTAIQLYDLQDKLGLSQPSKVVDWLIDNSKNYIDQLPPLQMPPGFPQFQQPMFVSHQSNASQSSLAPFFGGGNQYLSGTIVNSTGFDGEAARSLMNWEETKSKEVENVSDKGKWIKSSIDQENQEGACNNFMSAGQKFFPVISTHSSLPSLVNNPSMAAFGSYYHRDASSSLSLSQFGRDGFLPPMESPLSTNNSVSLPSPLSLSSAGSQLFLCPPATLQPSLFPPYSIPYNVTSTPVESDTRGINHFQLLSSSSQHFPSNTSRTIRSFTLDGNPGLVHLRSSNTEDNNNSDS